MEQFLKDPAVLKGLIVIAGLALLVLLVRVSQGALGRRVDDSARRYRLRKLITLAGYLAGALALAIAFGDRLSGLSVFFGVAGAGVAFALQEVIASAAGWIAMSFGRFYQVGDRVQLGGIRGDVIDIGVLRTTLMECGGWIDGDQYNGRVVRVANSFIFKEPVFNYSADFPFLWDEIKVPVRYGSDYEFARQEFQRVLDALTGEHAARLAGDWRKMTDSYLLEHAQLAPMVSLSMKENWAEFALRYVVDYKQRRSTRDSICTALLKAIEGSSNRIRLGAPSFELSAMPGLEVKLQQSAD